jgi:predicted protein tyrosine phosphatase
LNGAFRKFSESGISEVRYAETEHYQITRDFLNRHELIVVMEKRRKERMHQKYPEELAAKPCVCIFISDDYEFMDSNLIEILRQTMREYFQA